MNVGAAGVRAGDTRRVSSWVRSPDEDGTVVGLLRHLSGWADLDLVERESALAGLGAEAIGMAIVQVKPAEVQRGDFHRSAELLKGVDVDRHDRVLPFPPRTGILSRH